MTFMKMRFALVALPLAFAGLGACSTYGYGYSDYGYSDYGYNTGYGDGYGYDDYGQGGSYGGGSYGGGSYGGGSYGSVWNDAYYDNHYGAVHGGYWDLDGFFWYQSLLNGPYLRDHNRHFRRDYWNGGKHYRYVDRRNDRGRDWNDRDRNNTYPPLFAGQQGGNRDWNQNRNNDRNGGRSGNDGRDRSDDRARNEGGNRYNPPPLFSGQQPRAAPTPAPQLDGPPRGGNNDPSRDRGNDDDRGRGDGDRRNDGRARNDDRGQGGAPPPLFRGQQQQRAAPAPAPAQQVPRIQSQQGSNEDDDRPQRGQRSGQRNNDDANGERGRGRSNDRRGQQQDAD